MRSETRGPQGQGGQAARQAAAKGSGRSSSRAMRTALRARSSLCSRVTAQDSCRALVRSQRMSCALSLDPLSRCRFIHTLIHSLIQPIPPAGRRHRQQSLSHFPPDVSRRWAPPLGAGSWHLNHPWRRANASASSAVSHVTSRGAMPAGHACLSTPSCLSTPCQRVGPLGPGVLLAFEPPPQLGPGFSIIIHERYNYQKHRENNRFPRCAHHGSHKPAQKNKSGLSRARSLGESQRTKLQEIRPQ